MATVNGRDSGTESDAERLALVDRLWATAADLARCSTDFLRLLGSFVLLEALSDAQHRLAHVDHELACWHGTVSEGIQYKADNADRSGPDHAQATLKEAISHAHAAADSPLVAHTAKGTTRRYDTVWLPQQSIRSASGQKTRSHGRRPPTGGCGCHEVIVTNVFVFSSATVLLLSAPTGFYGRFTGINNHFGGRLR